MDEKYTVQRAYYAQNRDDCAWLDYEIMLYHHDPHIKRIKSDLQSFLSKLHLEWLKRRGWKVVFVRGIPAVCTHLAYVYLQRKESEE
jgi:hypothetical protein